MTPRTQLLKIFQANTGGRTTIKPPEIGERVETICGFHPSWTNQIKRSGKK